MSIQAWADLLRQTVTVEPRTGVDRTGAPTYGTVVSYKARVAGKRRMVRDLTGREVVSSYTVYLLSGATVHPGDRLTLPSGYAPQQPPILAVGTFPDETGANHHTEVYLA